MSIVLVSFGACDKGERTQPLQPKAAQSGVPTSAQLDQARQAAERAIDLIRKANSPPPSPLPTTVAGVLAFDRDRVRVQAAVQRHEDELAQKRSELVAILRAAMAAIERENPEDAIGSIAITIVEPRGSGKGFIGSDLMSREEVYIETRNQRPSRIHDSLRYNMLNGKFVRDGVMPAKNRLGVEFLLPRFVDPGDAPLSPYFQLRQQIVEINSTGSDAVRTAVDSALIPWRTAKEQIKDQFADQVTKEGQRVLAKAEVRARAVEAEAASEINRALNELLMTIGDTTQTPIASLIVQNALRHRQELIGRERAVLATDLASALETQRSRLEPLGWVQGTALRRFDVTSILEGFDKRRTDSINNAHETLSKQLADKGKDVHDRTLSLALTNAQSVEFQSLSDTRTEIETIRPLLGKSDSINAVELTIRRAILLGSSCLASERAKLVAVLQSIDEAARSAFQDWPQARDALIAASGSDAAVREYDAARSEAASVRLNTIGRRLTELTTESRMTARVRSGPSDFNVRKSVPLDSGLLLLGSSSDGTSSRLILIDGRGTIFGPAELQVSPKGLRRLAAWRMRDLLFVRVDDSTLLFDSELRRIAEYVNLRPDDALDVGDRLLITGDRGDGITRLWTVDAGGGAPRHSTKPIKAGMLRSGDNFLIVVPNDEASRNDVLAALSLKDGTIDESAMQPLYRDLMGSAETPESLSFRIVGGRIWVYARYGVLGLADGPTLIAMRPDGSFESPVFSHGIKTGDGNWDYKPQAVGKHKGCVETVALGRCGAAVLINENAAAEDARRIVFIDYTSKEQLWSEKARAVGFESHIDLINAAALKNESVVISVCEPVQTTQSAGGSVSVRRAVIDDARVGVASISETVVSIGDRIIVYHSVDLERNLPARVESLPGFKVGDKIFFGERVLEHIDLTP